MTHGIDISKVKWVSKGSTPAYVFISDPDGDMAVAVCDAEISPEYLKEHLDMLNHATAVVVETNLMPEALKFLAENCHVPIFADPVSVSKCHRILPVLGNLYGLKPNRLEAEALSGIQIKDEKSLQLAAETLLKTGLKQVYISLGAEGLFYADAKRSFLTPCIETTLVNSTGGGDTMMATIVLAFCMKLKAEEAVRLALAASAICVEHSETISPELSFERVVKRSDLIISGE